MLLLTYADHTVLSAEANEYPQQTQDVESMLVQRWSSVVDGGPTLN